ncbi:MAG: pitrilysin family protein [Planctomycetota bacterium]
MSLSFHAHTLPNGLQILAEHNPSAHSVAAGLFVKTGSRDESPDINGVSHFLEHMMFKGDDTLGWEDVNRIFDEIGARYNAFTSQEMTAYYAQVLPKFTDQALDMLGHLLRPSLRDDDFTTEKNVILEEIAMYQDDPGHRLYERVMAEHFGQHPLGMSILGPAERIEALTRDQMKGYFDSRYGPGNMVLSVAGAFDFDHIVAEAERLYGHWPRVFPDMREASSNAAEDRRVVVTDEKLNRSYTMALTAGPTQQDDARFAARVLSDILGDDEGSRLYWALVDPAIAEEADFGSYPHDGVGSFYLSLTTAPDRDGEAFDLARKVLADARGDITNDELQRAKNKIAGSLTLHGESIMGRMRSLGATWLYNEQYRSLEDDMQTVQALTLDDLHAVLEEFPLTPMTAVALRP